MELHGRVMPASNATFVGTLRDGGTATQVVYKPIAGERPLWDFPGAVLAHREVAAFHVAETFAGESLPVLVPPTWLGDGPHGEGMVQVWAEPDPDQSAVTIVPEGEVPAGYLHVFDGIDARDRDISLVHEDTPTLRQMAVFDALVNNADRKGGHVLEMTDGRRLGVDHGIAFHSEDKLRTVLWGWAGQPLTDDELEAVLRVRAGLGSTLHDLLAPLLGPLEIDCLARRCDRLVGRGVMPVPRGGGPAIPWPPF
ncbi:SCO1664 family protein [Nocardioides sp. CBS4Y-1]|uniref:SCO1664 family protein n=2 Tax=Nocardioides acrostichi TaxID=2784339 RepID=A0A930YE30_9ACTN|nr:SCO1664 family protein [Nocardioides acrostichi]